MGQGHGRIRKSNAWPVRTPLSARNLLGAPLAQRFAMERAHDRRRKHFYFACDADEVIVRISRFARTHNAGAAIDRRRGSDMRRYKGVADHVHEL